MRWHKNPEFKKGLRLYNAGFPFDRFRRPVWFIIDPNAIYEIKDMIIKFEELYNEHFPVKQ